MWLVKKTTLYISGYSLLYLNYDDFAEALLRSVTFYWDIIEPHQEWAVPLIKGISEALGFLFGGSV